MVNGHLRKTNGALPAPGRGAIVRRHGGSTLIEGMRPRRLGRRTLNEFHHAARTPTSR